MSLHASNPQQTDKMGGNHKHIYMRATRSTLMHCLACIQVSPDSKKHAQYLLLQSASHYRNNLKYGISLTTPNNPTPTDNNTKHYINNTVHKIMFLRLSKQESKQQLPKTKLKQNISLTPNYL